MNITIETARKLVRQYTACTDGNLLERIAQRMHETGECVWHATAQVTGKRCWCAECEPNVSRFA